MERKAALNSEEAHIPASCLVSVNPPLKLRVEKAHCGILHRLKNAVKMAALQSTSLSLGFSLGHLFVSPIVQGHTVQCASIFLSFLAGLVLNKNISVAESRNFQLDVVVNDTLYQGPDKSLMLHFNVTVLPISIQFPNVTYQFTVNRNAANFSQVRVVCVFVWLLRVR